MGPHTTDMSHGRGNAVVVLSLDGNLAAMMRVALAIAVTLVTSAAGCSPAKQTAVTTGEPPERIEEEAAEGSSLEPVRKNDGPRCPHGMTFVPGGEFTAPQLERIQRQEHYEMRPRVDDFCLAVGEVSEAEHDECCLAAVCCALEDVVRKRRAVERRTPEEKREPWVNVSPLEAEAYCEFRGFRLPTVEEWLWAAYGGQEDRMYPWGNEPFDETRDNVCDRECVLDGRCDPDDPSPTYDAHGWEISVSTEECIQELLDVNDPSTPDGFPGLAPVASFPAGSARWGQRNMFANAHETATGGGTYFWVGGRYWGNVYNPSSGRDLKGWQAETIRMGRLQPPSDRTHNLGARCAASPALIKATSPHQRFVLPSPSR
jgi:formylglycine-generating enzyme required for sulfatase activity